MDAIPLDRRIYITGDIDNPAFTRFVKKLTRLEEESTDAIQITLVSDGGSAYSALAFFDRIRQSNHDIYIIASGLVASAAVLILAAGTHRFMTPGSWVMVHEDTPVIDPSKKVSEVEKEIAHDRRLEIQWNRLLANVTKASETRWTELHKAETYLSPSECLELGLIDGII